MYTAATAHQSYDYAKRIAFIAVETSEYVSLFNGEALNNFQLLLAGLQSLLAIAPFCMLLQMHFCSAALHND